MVLVSETQLIQGVKAGEAVSFPTDTVPALAVKPSNAKLIYEIKQRPPTKPLILMGASLEDLLPYIAGTPEERDIWKAIANKYFPGALTLVLPATDLVPATMNPTNSQTIGIRIPASDTARKILQCTGVLATTSANLSGEVPLVTTQDINSAFPNLKVLESETPNQPQGNGLPSTVVKWTGTNWQLLRQGSVVFDLTQTD